MKRSQPFVVGLTALILLLLVAPTVPARAASSHQATCRRPAQICAAADSPASVAPAWLAPQPLRSRIDPPDQGVCVTRPGQPCPRPPLFVQ